MSDKAQGDGDSVKTDAEDQDKSTPTFTKQDLSDKFRDGRTEGIEKGTRDALSIVNKVLDTNFESLEDVETGLPEVTSQKVEESDVVKSLQDKLKEKETTIQSLNQKVQDFRVSGQKSKEYQAALGDKKLKIDTEDAVRLFESDFDYKEEDGKLLAIKGGEKVLTDDGDFATIGDAFADFVKQKKLIEGGASGGAGGGTSSKSGQGYENNPFATGNVTEQAKLFRTNRALYDKLKAEAKK